MTDYRHRFRHRHLLTIARLLVMFSVLAKPLVAIELSNFKIADEDVNLGDELLNESWLLWNETEQSTENYCFLTTHLDRSSPCLLTDTMQHQSNSNRDGQAGMDPSLRDDADSQQVFLIKSATSAIRSCYKQSSTKKTCSDCSVVHKKIDVVNHIYNGSADNIVASVNVDTSLLTLQQWYQWCASELTAPAGDDPRLFYLDFFNTSGFLRLCGYRNLSCTTADGCFVGVEVTQLIVNNSKTNNCILPLEQESKSHRAESIALAVSFGTVFILVLVGASIVVFVKQQRKRGRLRETPPMSAFPAANYHELSLFQDSDSTSSSDSEELGLN